MSRISSNLLGGAARLGYLRSQDAIQTALERLSTGKRINRASDDPAGIVAIGRFDAERIGLEKKIESLDLNNHGLAARDGALSVVEELLLELDGIVVTAANRDALGDEEIKGLQTQANSILDTLDMLSQTSIYRGEYLLSGFASHQLAVGFGEDTPGEDGAPGVPNSLASIRTGGAFDLVSGDLEAAQQAVRSTREMVTNRRGAIGNQMNENDRLSRAYHVQLENLAGAMSQIQDADYAAEVSNLVRAQVLSQASLSAMAIGRQQAAGSVLSLLRA